MCRMLGMVSVRELSTEGAAEAAPLPSWRHLVTAPHALQIQAETGKTLRPENPGHRDSWGIGWFDEGGQVALVRQTGSAGESGDFALSAEAAVRPGAAGPTRVLLAHLRKAACGEVTLENAHPIRADFAAENRRKSLLVAHNGTVKGPLLDWLRRETAGRSEAGSDCDTVVLAGWLAQKLEQTRWECPERECPERMARIVAELLERAVRLADGTRERVYSGVNLLLAVPEGLYALRQFSRDEDYYTLLARPLRPEDGGSGWIVASEPTDGPENWEPLPPGVLSFYSTRQWTPQTFQVAP